MERSNISLRAQSWERIINECTFSICQRIFDITCQTQRDIFKYEISENISNHLMEYLLEWNGLNTKLIHSTKKPKSFKDYELKAKNWLNGRRAKQYSVGLYVDMIVCAEKYANYVTIKLFNHILNENDKELCKTLFYDCLMYSYLTTLCESECHINERKVWLLCANSMKTHKQNETIRIFQLYAKDYIYVEQFPRHRNEAIDYFKKKMEKKIMCLLVLFQEIETRKVPQKSSEKLLEIMTFIGKKCKVNDGKCVMINKKTLSMIDSAIKYMKISEKQQLHQLKELNDKIYDLQKSQQERNYINNYQNNLIYHPIYNNNNNNDNSNNNNNNCNVCHDLFIYVFIPTYLLTFVYVDSLRNFVSSLYLQIYDNPNK